VSPSATKQMSKESGLSATRSPRAAASRRTCFLGGELAEREQRVRQPRRSATASTYDWSFAAHAARCSSTRPSAAGTSRA